VKWKERTRGTDTDTVLVSSWAGRKKALQQRARVLQEIRRFFTENGYLEIEPPTEYPPLHRKLILMPSLPVHGFFIPLLNFA